MEYSKLIAITGKGGLFEMIASKKDGAIVKSLEDSANQFVSSRIHNFSHLESIEVYTVQDNVNLADIFKAMQTSKEARPDAKDAAAVKKYFQSVYPDMDFERVYSSDMKKMVKWLEQLEKHQIEIKLAEENAAEIPAAEPAPVAEPVAEEAPAEAAVEEKPKPVKKARKKKTEE
jgi:hypothetical protein